jgi:hypothetical protein
MATAEEQRNDHQEKKFGFIIPSCRAEQAEWSVSTGNKHAVTSSASFVLRLLMIILLGADMKVAFSYKLDFPLLPGIAWLMSGGGVRDAFSIRNKYAAIDCSQCVCSGQGQGRS